MHARTRTQTDVSRTRGAAVRAPTRRPPPEPAPTAAVAYRPGLSGLRALAVAGIVLANTGHRPFPGGAIVGIEIFFVLAGYLTATMLAALGHIGAADIARFAGRRARRVLPALLTVLGGVSLLVLTTQPDALEHLAPDIRTTLTGLGNWDLIASATAPPQSGPAFLGHLWPLAVGAQLTVGVAVAMLLLRSRRSRAVLRLAAVALALGSTVGLALLSASAAVPERALYGTDTRATGLLIGVALGLALRPPGGGALRAERARRLQVLGLLALAGVVAAMTIGGGGLVWLTRGGLLLVDLLAAIVIAVIVRGARLDGMLGSAGPRWLGLRSFAIYLWHWPVLLAMGGPLAMRQPVVAVGYVVAVVVLADLTYRFVEVPLGGARHVPREGLVGASTVAVRTTAIAGGAACAVTVLSGLPWP